MYGSVTTRDDLLALLHRFQVLTIFQITRLLQKQSSINNIRSKMKRLVNDGMVEVQFLPHTTPSGSTPMVYALSSKGARYIEGSRAVASTNGQKMRGILPLQHLLDINDVLIQSLLLQTFAPAISVLEYTHEKTFKQNPIKISEKSFLVPDGFTRFALSPPYGKPGTELGVIWEVDRNTEDAYTIREKIRCYRKLFYGHFEQVFGVQVLIAAFVITQGGEGRVKQLVRATEQELKHVPDDGEYFLFSSASPTIMLPLEFFTSPQFLQPFQSTPVPLIERR